MKFKKYTFNLLSVMIGFHYGRNPVNNARFLHVAPVPFFGLDFYWPADLLAGTPPGHPADYGNDLVRGK